MGHKNQEKAQSQVAYNTALTTAKEETPYERKRREFNEGIVDYAAKGDYRQPPAAGKVFYNFADPAQQKANRALLDNTRGQGVSALGAGANPELLALNKQHMDDVAERDAAQNYQATTAKLVSGAYNDLGDMQQAADAKKLNILGTTAGQYGQQSQIAAAKPKWWQVLLGGGQAAATAGLKDGGRVDPYIGKRVLTGEAGPEALVNDDGTTKMLGVGGPQMITPQQPGTVVPNNQLPDFLKFTRTPVGDSGGALPASRPRTVAPVNAPPQTQAGSVGVDETGATETRPRFADPAGRLEKQIAYEGEHPAHDSNERLKSGLKELAVNAAQGFVQGGLPGAVRGGIVGGALGALQPATDEEQGQAKRVHKWQEQLASLRANEAAKLGSEEKRARIDATKAGTEYTRVRLGMEQSKAAARASKDAQAAVRADLKLHPHPFDPASEADAAFLHRAADAGVFLDVDNWGRGGKNDRAVTYVDPDNPTRVVSGHYNTFTGEVAPLTLAGQPVQKGYVAPVHGDTEMTSAQEAGVTDRRAGQAETHRHNTVSESQGGQRIQQGDEHIAIARDNQAHRGEPTAANTNARLARAAELNRKLEDEKNRAAHPPKMINGVATTDAYRQGYTERHRQAAAGFAEQIHSAYGDLYETGADADGWHYAKPKVQPGAGVRAGGGSGATYSEDEVRQRARAAGRDENAAVEAARRGGLIKQ